MSVKQSSTISLQLRLTAIFLGIALFLWLPIEDATTTGALLFAIAINTWLVATFLIPKRISFRSPFYNYILAGTLAGAFVTPIALLLMAFKTGLHGHEAPDYTTQQLLSIIRRTPIWIVGGLLISSGSGIWVTKRKITASTE